MDIKKVRKLLNPQFGYIAKSTGEPLYIHHYMVWSICTKLSSYVPSLDEREKELLEIACLVHDIGKMDREFQEALRTGKRPPPHKITTKEELYEFLEKCNIPLSDLGIQSEEDLQFIADIIRTHHGTSKRDLIEINTTAAKFFTQLLTTADWLASMHHISFETMEKLRRLYSNRIDFACVQCSRFSSPTFMLIIGKLIEHFKEKGWTPLCFPENGVIFIAKHGTQLPQKDRIIDEILSKIIKDSLSFQNPIPKRADRDLLVSLARYFPLEFLETHKSTIINQLGYIDVKGFVFLKIYNDLLKSLAYDPVGNNVVKLIRKACGSAGHIKTEARSEFKKVYGKDISDMKELLNELFNRLKVKEILKDDLITLTTEKEYLRDLKSVELYEILRIIAGKVSSNELRETLKNYLSTIVLMEEDIDFKKLALEVFEKYKSYKLTSDAERGACEICGCPIGYRMQPALNLSRPPQAFSQIKAKYAYRSICAFCAYDNLVLRKDVSPGKVRVYLKIKSRVPDLFLNYDEMKILINRLVSATRSIRNIIKFEENVEFRDLPFPEKIEIPVGDDKREIGFETILRTEDSILFKLEDISEKDFSPKDMKAKYELLYHLMKLLGFEVSIGTEEQTELFGEKVITNEENYYKSLITIILAGLHDKKSRKYIFAKNLLEKAPSITIRAVGDFVDSNKFSYELVNKLINFLIRGLLKTNIVIARR